MEHWQLVGSVDRIGARTMGDAHVTELWRRPGSRLLLIDAAGNLSADPENGRLLPTGCAGEWDPQQHFLLGTSGGRAWFVTAGEGERTASLRQLNSRLDVIELELATEAVALMNWHRLEPFCPRCAAPTVVADAGFARHCPQCDRQLFPRTDPAVIVAVLDAADRLLLGHQSTWPAGRMSLLAGFVEAGESLEQAVHRELAEEVGVRLTDLRYFGSQPWPFPRSQMIGYVARAQSEDFEVDGIEITEARWFSRPELAAEVEAERVSLPMPGSIARRIIDAWQADALSL